MGLSKPRTKAECDERIAGVQRCIISQKNAIASMPNGKPGSSAACSKNAARSVLASHQNELAQLKALRKTLK